MVYVLDGCDLSPFGFGIRNIVFISTIECDMRELNMTNAVHHFSFIFHHFPFIC